MTGLARDFLSPIVQGLAFKDVPLAVACPFGYAGDRLTSETWGTRATGYGYDASGLVRSFTLGGPV